MTFPTELQDRWTHADPEIRLLAIDELEAQAGETAPAETAQQVFAEIAATDSDNRVRLAAAGKVSDAVLLDQLCHQTRQKDKAVYKHCKEKLDAIQLLQKQENAAIARAMEICQSLESLASKTPGPLSAAQHEYLLSQWQTISAKADPAVQARVDAANASLQKTIGEFLAERSQETQITESMLQLNTGLLSVETFITSLRAPVDNEQMQNLESHLHELQSLLAAFPVDIAHEEAGDLLKKCRTLQKTLSACSKSWQTLQGKAKDFEKLQESLQSTSHKDTKALLSLQNRIEKLMSTLDWPKELPESSWHQSSSKMLQSLSEHLQKNTEWQEKLTADIAANRELLEKNIEEGHLADAQKLWDKIQSAINNIAEPQRHTLLEQLAPYKKRIGELQDWKNFAATEKKKELTEKMQLLVDSNQPIPQRAKLIRALQEDWKKLGHSDDNDLLWTQFNEVAHKAFEPCKEYFKERKEKMSSNLKERNQICETLEYFLENSTPESLNIAETTKLEVTAQEEWKRHAPVAQNKIKNLQKRFNGILNAIRQLKRKTLQHNAGRKLALIEQAEKLIELENFQEAISEVKRLQSEWKAIGPSPYKDDRNHWHTFRQACDKIFARRDELAAQQKTEARKVVSAARDTLKKLGNLLDLGDEEFLESKKQFTELKETFYSQLNPDLKAERRQLLDQFERISKKYEARQKASPDRKSLQLINQIRSRAEFLENLEQSLLSASEESNASQQELQEQWQALDAISDADLAQRMEKRFKTLCQHLTDARKLQKLAAENETLAREHCVEMEIQAGADSPAQDKALRMKIQLNHLKQGFGQNRNAGKSKSQIIGELELQFLCMGPLSDATRKSLQMRINGLKNA